MGKYGIDIWGNDNFSIRGDSVQVDYKSSPTILEIVKKLRLDGLKGPMILRFPHLIAKQIDSLYSKFDIAISENSYNGSFNAVFPLKVNQFPKVVQSICEAGDSRNYGLEAGSKAELILAIHATNIGSPITVNGFKDTEMIMLCFMAAQMGHNITVTIEGLGELESIIEVAEATKLKKPNIGIRVRLHSGGSGAWAKSGGINSKFGLTSTEMIEAINLLKESELIESFHMLHFHIGSQMEDISPLKKAIREAGNIYAELKKIGATHLNSINIGGGLAVEYAQHASQRSKTYSLDEFANDVVFLLGGIMNAKSVEHPHIFTESGRFIVAQHAVLIAPVLELFSQDYQEKSLQFKEVNPPLIEELRVLNDSANQKNCMEYLHDALDHMESLLTLFDLGYIDLQDRSNAEILVHQIIKKALYLAHENETPEFEKLQSRLEEKYLINCSIFQSMPDYWGLGQTFPVIPIQKLDKKARRAASLWDITCDSDGEIDFNSDAPLYLHDINIDEEEYFLAFFNVGAYQETLGMNHNLFVHPNEAIVDINDNGYEISYLNESKSILDILEDLGYNSGEILTKLKGELENSTFITKEEKSDTLQKLYLYLHQNGYLRTTK